LRQTQESTQSAYEQQLVAVQTSFDVQTRINSDTLEPVRNMFEVKFEEVSFEMITVSEDETILLPSI
jgi:hypothetical protein